jgi:uncharacterized protein YidB (DUF937 family)
MDLLNLAQQFLSSSAGQNMVQQNGFLAMAVKMVQNHPGGLNGLLQQFQSSGLADQVKSWVSTGANQPVTADQVQQALGNQVSALAQQSGGSMQNVAQSLATMLPQLVDQLTPQGVMPENNDGINAALEALKQKLAA